MHTVRRRTTGRRKMATAHVPNEQPDHIEVIELDRAEYDQAVKAELAELGMTYKQLEREAQAVSARYAPASSGWL